MSEQLIDSLLPVIEQLEGSANAARQQGVPEEQVRSPVGAVGKYQIMPNTARLLGYDPARLTEPDYNKQVARAALADLIKQHGTNDMEAVVAGYNASPGAVTRWKRAGRNINALPTETQGYMQRYRKIAATTPTQPRVADPLMSGPEGKVLLQEMMDAGLPAREVAAYKQQQAREMLNAGLPAQEVAKYWGDSEIDFSAVDKLAQDHVVRFMGMNVGTVSAGEWKSTSLFADFMSGYSKSNTSLTLKAPSKIEPQAGLASAVAQGAGQMLGDLPVAVPAAIGGFFAGGGPFTAGAAGMAAPEAYRGVLMDGYRHEQGPKTFGEAWDRYSGVAWDTAVAGTMGAVFPVGGKMVAAPMLKYTGSRILSSTAEMVAGNSLATGVGAAMNGEVPDAEHFLASSILLLGIHGVVSGIGPRPRPSEAAINMASRMRNIYERTGVSPFEQAEMARKDPAFKADLMNEDANLEPIVERFNQVKKPEVEPVPAKEQKTVEQKMKEATDTGDAEGLAAAKKQESALDNADPAEVSMLANSERDIPPQIARELGYDIDKLKKDPEYKNKAGLEILQRLLSHFDGDKEAAFIAFNSSIGQAEKWKAMGRKDASIPATVQRGLERAQREGAFDDRAADGGPLPPKKHNAPPPGGEEPPGAGAAAGGDRQRKIKDDTMKKDPKIIMEETLDLVGEEPVRSVLGRTGDLFRAGYDEFFSELGPFKRLDKALELKDGQVGIEDAFRSTYASNERAGHFLTVGTFEPIAFKLTSNENLMGAYNLAKKNGGTKHDFVGYRLAMRFLEKAKQGIDTGWRNGKGTVEQRTIDAKRMVKEYSGKYQDALAIATRVNNAKLDYMRDSGLYSEEQIAKFKQDNKAWIPHTRVPESAAARASSGRSFSKFMPGKRLQKMEGSDRQIIDPVVNEVESFVNGIASADRNRATGSIVGSQETMKAAGIKRVNFDEPLIERDQKRIGYSEKFIETPDGETLKQSELRRDPIVEDPDTFLDHQRNVYGSLKANEFPYWRNGKLEVYAVYDVQLAKAIRGATTFDAGMIGRGATWVAGVQRSGITSLPDYMAKMIIRDQFTTPILDKYGGAPFQNFTIGMWHMIGGKADTFASFVRRGGYGGSLASLDANYVTRNVDKIFFEAGTYDRVLNKVANPIEASRLVMERLDAVSRLGYDIRRIRAGEDPFKSAMRSRKAYIDFKEKALNGFVNTWSSWTTFLRPFMLGLDQFGHAIKTDPMGVAMKGAAYIATPTAVLYALNYLADKDKTLDDPSRYDQVPEWERDTHFVFPEVGGVRIRLPRSQGPVAFMAGGLTERALRFWQADDAHAFDTWANQMAAQFYHGVTPAAVYPMMEHWSGTSFFSGSPLVPSYLEGASGHMQYTDNTSDPARWLSRFIAPAGVDVSPIYLDNYVRSYLGTVGADILKGLNATRDDGKPWTVADVPMVASFVVRNPTMRATTIQYFFDAHDKFKKDAKDWALGLKRLNQTEMDIASQNAGAFVKLEEFATVIGDHYSIIQAINDNKEMKMVEKAQFIESQYEMMIAMSRNGLALADEAERNAAAMRAAK